VALVVISLPLFSQGAQGTIQGSVFDQSGGAIAGAAVAVIDVARGVTRALTTDGAGQYIATDLTAGTYTVRAEAKGFRTEEHNGVLVEVARNIRIDLVLQPGEQTQTITVTGAAPSIDSSDSTLGGTVSNDAVNSLPLNGRNFQRLLQLRPGVVSTPGSGTGQTSTNGRRVGNDVIVVEGIPQFTGTGSGNGVVNVAVKGGDSQSLLPIDSIQEFNTQQNPGASTGWRDGSTISVGVKSGTNSIHGTAYAFGRDASATDAANYFTSAVTPATLEQFGATAGGPILKNKLFWFVGFEGLRVFQGSVTVLTIPADVSMGGNTSFSMVDACNSLNPNHLPLGAAGNKINALSAQLSGLNPVTCAVTPSSSTVENLFPFTTNTTTSGNFAPGLGASSPLNNGVVKGDYVLSAHHHLSGMYYKSKASQVSAGSALVPQWESDITSDVEMSDGAWTWTPNSVWVNDVRFGLAYFNAETLPADLNLMPSNPYPNGYSMNTGVTNPLYGGLPTISIRGFGGSLGQGGSGSIRGPEGDLALVETASYLHGKHSFKFGFDYVRILFDANSFKGNNGSITFANLTSFLQGTTQSGSIAVGSGVFNGRANWYSAFAQDDWRVAPRVILNLGLRWEFIASPWERDNYVGEFDPNVNPATTPAVQQVGPGEPIPSWYKNDYKGFSPRVGAAWDVRGNGKTVVRAGASVQRNAEPLGPFFNSDPFGATFFGGTAANPVLIGPNNSGTVISAHSQTSYSFSNGNKNLNLLNWNTSGPPIFSVAAPTVINNVTYLGQICSVASQCSVPSIDPHFHEAYAAEWNLDIQRAITNNLTVSVAYVGNHGFDQFTHIDQNQRPLGVGWNTPAVAGGLTPAQICLNSAPLYNSASCNPNGGSNTAAEVGPYSSTFPYISYISTSTNEGFSNYNGLQVTAIQRAWRGLSFITGYTYSHALDTFSVTGGRTPMTLIASNPGILYGSSNNDLRHRFTFSPTYLIPGMKSPGEMLQGWSVGGILTLQGGMPWSPGDGTNDLDGSGMVNDGVSENWNYNGPKSAFTAGTTSIPCYTNALAANPIPGCTPYQVVGGVPQPPAACMTAAQANGPLAVASLMNLGCYVQNGGVLTPAAYGTIGNANRNLFRGPHYYNTDFSVAKIWTFKERYSAQFRAEFFNIFNHADFASTPGKADPSAGGLFGAVTSTPDSGNPVLGSGGPRHIQFALKLTF
jgi:hypothetical protein